ncbi:MAG: riboflavin synthase [Verrucomicrobia subdivision 3 bacterium]|nr:riboflavin synthase [Limisphaerales bacterium]
MFTGIVEEAATVTHVQEGKESIEFAVDSKVCAKALKIGDSLAVNGCCLTVVNRSGLAKRIIHFDLLLETWKRTNLQFMHPGSLVNLERPLAANGRLDGHFVTGHIDGIGSILRWEQSGKDWVLEVFPPEEVMRYLVPKGSVAVDGISLTVAEVRKKSFVAWIIPHTRDHTAMSARTVSDAVNLEADILGKYVEKFVKPR